MPRCLRDVAFKLALLLPAIVAPSLASAQPSETRYPMTADRWQGDKTSFRAQEGFPTGVMTVADGYAVLQNGSFAEGTVEFDMKPLEYSDTGILLHRRDADTAEFVYLRADPDCPAANDCVQYAPVTNGRMQWNTYSRYQGPAPISEKGWNHLRIVVSGGRMRLYVNRERQPSLDVPQLEGLADRGGIAVKGPAVFANLVVRPDDKRDSARSAVASTPSGVVRRWLLGPVTPAPADRAPTLADAPTTGWQPFETEPDGLANLSRAIPRNTTAGLQMAWLKVTIDAREDGEKVVDLGFVPRAWLFLNGRQVYAGENFYYPADKRLTPEGRFAPDNARVRLTLRKGANDLVLAMDDAWRRPNGQLVPDHYGWAGMIRFEDGSGIVVHL